jgi:hypothetical protein
MGFTIVTSEFEYPTGTGQFFERRPWREAGRIGKTTLGRAGSSRSWTAWGPTIFRRREP